MPSCLGVYVQKNLIKYAKVSKENNKLKVEAYGIKFYETDIEKTIEQIVQETFSYQIPISINIEKEKYEYANVFNLLKPQDLEKAIETEFEFFCNNNNKNKNAIEFRKLKAHNLEDRDKVRVIYTYVDKVNIIEKIQLLDKYRAHNVYPLPTILPNLNKSIMQENCVLVNIEQNTEITTVVNGKIYKIDKLDVGMDKILGSIAEKENSFNRAYEICKNTTVYTKSSQNLKIEGNEYLDEIITSLFEIIEKVKENITNSGLEINNIYISGMGLIINNIDLLFQENFIDKKCEILIPYFIEKTNVKINIKDYIEVNSAISLAIQGLETKYQETNFKEQKRDLWALLTTDIGKGKGVRVKKDKERLTFKQLLSSESDWTDRILLRVVALFSLIIMLYVATTELLAKAIETKIAETEQVIINIDTEIAKVEEYEKLINTKTTEYLNIIQTIDSTNAEISDSYSRKNAIPNLLNQIMYVVPTEVRILLIRNDTGKNVTIVAQAEEYNQLGYFKAALEEEGILTNVNATKATKQNNLINITLTGELVY